MRNINSMFLFSAVNVKHYKKVPEMTKQDGERFKLGTDFTSA